MSKKLTADEAFTKFTALESLYGSRNERINLYSRFFDGDHWNEQTPETGEFQIVLNYCRAVTMKFASLLARSPAPRIPLVIQDSDLRDKAAKREKYLRVLWPDLMRAWRDVEFNASKKTYGVLQVLWQPGEGQPDTITVGVGGDQAKKTAFTKSPFLFRSIAPEHFYPVYRTFDTPDDFLYVFRFAPGRLIEDIEEKYDVVLQSTTEKAGSSGTCDLIEFWSNTQYLLLARTQRETKDRRGHVAIEKVGVTLKDIEHEYRRPPFWVLQNLRSPDADPTDGGSLGDIDAIAELNKHLNLLVSEASEEIITNIHRPTAYASNDHQQDPNKIKLKAGAIIPIGLEEKLEPITWQGLPNAVNQHIAGLVADIENLSFVGAIGFGQYPNRASGTGLQIALQSMENILDLKVPLREELLADVCLHLLRITEARLEKSGGAKFALWVKDAMGRYGQVTLAEADIDGNYFVDIDFGNLLPRNETAHQQNEVYKYKTGVQSLRTTLDNIGVEAVDEELALLRDELNDPVLNPEKVIAIAQAKQLQKAPEQPQTAPQPPGTAQAGTSPISQVPSALAAPSPGVQGPPVPQEQPGMPGQPPLGPGNIAPMMARSRPGPAK